MSPTMVERIADAVLYEGYLLYPYRPSAVKNQQRWNFGALFPEAYSLAQRNTEAWSMQTECLVHGSEQTTLEVKVRFLHLLMREVGEPTESFSERDQIVPTDFRPIPSIEINGRLIQTFQEASERDVPLPVFSIGECLAHPQKLKFDFPSSQTIKPLRDNSSDRIAGLIVRRQQAITVEVSVASKSVGDNAFKITVRIMNLTPLEEAEQKTRDEALMRSFVSTHTILNAHDGEFISLLDPPTQLSGAAAGCVNVGTYPVLAGEEGERGCMLSSPIILYDYPRIAPESAGNLFDGTEIDEILTLRIMTLTDEEKREMRDADDRARQILERTEMLPMEQLLKLHGAVPSLRQHDEKK
jgi:hypothetical protein